MKCLFSFLLVLTIVVGSTAPSQGNANEKKVIGNYSWTSDCKCVKVSPTFAQYVPVSNCKGVTNSFGCK